MYFGVFSSEMQHNHFQKDKPSQEKFAMSLEMKLAPPD